MVRFRDLAERRWNVAGAQEERDLEVSEVEVAATERTEGMGYEIVINGSRFEVKDETVTYEQVVALGFSGADPNVIYSVAYRRAKGGHGGSGTLVPGTSVTVKKKGTTFDVTPTTRS
jgi:hypothetical protein